MGGGIAVYDGWANWFEKAYLDKGYTQQKVDEIFYNTWLKFAPAKLTLNGGEIINNTATRTDSNSGTGGGIYAGSNNVVLNAGLIDGNTAEHQGGGVYVPSTPYELKMSNVIVSDNYADKIGGGIWLCPTGNVVAYLTNGGAFYNNEANSSLGAGNEVASVNKGDKDYILTLADRLLGGGTLEWWHDGAIKESGNLGDADPDAPRFPNTEKLDESVFENKNDLALSSKTKENGHLLAMKFAKLKITIINHFEVVGLVLMVLLLLELMIN